LIDQEENMAEITLTAANFEEEVLKSDKPVLVDFWATWCGPCKMVGPIVAQIAEEKADTLKVGKLNVDDEMEIARRYGIMAIPTMILFKDGEEAAKVTGFLPKEQLLAQLGL
jgi:thioredoxin 1